MKTLSDLEIIAGGVLKQCMQVQPEHKMLGDMRAIDLVRLALFALQICPMCNSQGFENGDNCNLCSLAQNIRTIELAVAAEKLFFHAQEDKQ